MMYGHTQGKSELLKILEIILFSPIKSCLFIQSQYSVLTYFQQKNHLPFCLQRIKSRDMTLI